MLIVSTCQDAERGLGLQERVVGHACRVLGG